MKNIVLFVMFAVCGLCSPLRAAEDSSPENTPPPLSAKPEIEKLVAEYETQQKALDEEIAPKLKAARDLYLVELDILIHNLSKNIRTKKEAEQVTEEVKRFRERGLNGEPSKSLPPKVRVLWGTLLRSTATANQPVLLKRSAVRSQLLRGISPLEQGYRARNDAEGLALVRRVRAAATVRSAVDEGRVAETDLAGSSSGSWRDVVREGGYLIGFQAGSGQWYQYKVVGAMQPVFATARGLRDGEKRGVDGKHRVIAREGYAVGGLEVRRGDVVDSARIIFMRINPDGISLDPQNFYKSQWLGRETEKEGEEITGRGRMIVGVTGGSSFVIHSIGLISLK